MPHRIFTDIRGVAWDVWDVVPRSATSDSHQTGPTAIIGALAHGWLAFQAGDARRRLAPIPTSWEEASDEQLGRWCAEAPAVVPRQPRGTPGARTEEEGATRRDGAGTESPASPMAR